MEAERARLRAELRAQQSQTAGVTLLRFRVSGLGCEKGINAEKIWKLKTCWGTYKCPLDPDRIVDLRSTIRSGSNGH